MTTNILADLRGKFRPGLSVFIGPKDCLAIIEREMLVKVGGSSIVVARSVAEGIELFEEGQALKALSRKLNVLVILFIASYVNSMGNLRHSPYSLIEAPSDQALFVHWKEPEQSSKKYPSQKCRSMAFRRLNRRTNTIIVKLANDHFDTHSTIEVPVETVTA